MSEQPGGVPGRKRVQRTDATVLLCRFMATTLCLFGVYMVLHGTVTPGGGFQGGVIVASSFMLLYLGEGYRAWRRIVRSEVLDLLEGAGALAYALAAALPLLGGYAALQNVLPLGTWKDLFSGGLMVPVNYAVAFAVIGGFGMLLLEFMEETRGPESDPVPNGEGE
jgi:multicomponent Na+:H+ antiporter subunit B